MEVEKKIETLEGELKLMKGGVQETLVNVRDFLLSLKLPLPAGVHNLDGDGSLAIRGSLGMTEMPRLPAAAAAGKASEKTYAEDPPERPPERQPAPPAASSSPETPTVNTAISVTQGAPKKQFQPAAPGNGHKAPPACETPPDSEMGDKQSPSEDLKEENASNTKPETGKSREDNMKDSVTNSPQVNLLANLIRWVSVARDEIGLDQLPTFLDVYAISGSLSAELKEVILHLAEVVQPSLARDSGVYSQAMREQLAAFLDIHRLNGQMSAELREGILLLASSMARSPEARASDVWSRLMLELHGILAGSGTPLHLPGLVSGNGSKDKEAAREAVAAKKEAAEATAEEAAAVKSQPREDRPVRLKLVVPAGNGDKEFDIEEFSVSLD